MSVINTNITSMIGQSNLNKSQNALQTSMERLSSGLRINSAKDDAAGQAIANRMTAQITGLAQAQRNANDGISIAQTAEGSLNQINDNLQRIRELTVQAQNGTNSASDIDSIQQEVNQRLEEIDRIARETDFNGTKVLDVGDQGTNISIQVGAKDGEMIDIKISDQGGWNLFKNGEIAVGEVGGVQRGVAALGFDVRSAVVAGAGGSTTAEASGIADLDENNFTGMDTFTNVVQYTDEDGNTAYAAIGEDAGTDPVAYAVTFNAAGEATAGDALAGDNETAALGSSEAVTDGDTVTVAPVTISGVDALDENNFTGMDTFTNVVQYTDEDGNTAYAAIGEDAGTDPVAYAVTIGADGVAAAGDALTGDNLAAALASTDTVTDGDPLATGDAGAGAAGGPLAALDAALAAVDAQRSELGAIQNRFEDAITNLNTNETNLAAARSRIEDADYAVEVANMTRAQILQQAGTSVLAQANQIPQNVLSLLG